MFLEKLRGEKPGLEKVKARELILQENAAKKNVICTSAITRVEAFPSKLVDGAVEKEAQFNAMFDAKKIYDIDVSPPILQLARHIRDFYYRIPRNDGKEWVMDTGDAIHLATAISQDVDEFHTRDNSTKKGNVPLLTLKDLTATGQVANQWSLKIVSPETTQRELDVDVEENGDDGEE